MTDRRKLRSDDGDNNVVLHHFPILPSPTPSMCCLFSFFRTRAADQHTSKYVCTIFPTSSPPIGGEGNTIYAREKTDTFVYVYPRFTKKLVHFPIVGPNGIWIFSFIILLQKGREGCGWMLEASSFPLQRDL